MERCAALSLKIVMEEDTMARPNWSWRTQNAGGAETTSKTPPVFIDKNLILANLIFAGMEKQAAKKMEIGWLISKPSIEDLVIPIILPAHMGTKRFFSEAQKSGLLTFDNFPRAAKEQLRTKLMKCLSKTASLSDGLGKGPKSMPP